VESPVEVSAARQFVESELIRWGRGNVADVVVLLVSEVVTNVVVHAGPHGPSEKMVVAASVVGDAVRVEVTDRHPGFPVVGDGTVDALSGRGMVLLDALASAWGVLPIHSGKLVWFEVRADPSPASAVDQEDTGDFAAVDGYHPQDLHVSEGTEGAAGGK
jgi:hypothetical protein